MDNDVHFASYEVLAEFKDMRSQTFQYFVFSK